MIDFLMIWRIVFYSFLIGFDPKNGHPGLRLLVPRFDTFSTMLRKGVFEASLPGFVPMFALFSLLWVPFALERKPSQQREKERERVRERAI